jgi:hypothetical protein
MDLVLWRSGRRLLRAAVVLAGVSASLAAQAVAAEQTPFTIATGIPGGVFLAVGNAICRLFNLAEERRSNPCLAAISSGSVDNARRTRRGDATLGLVQSDVTYAAYRGTEGFAAAGPDADLRVVLAVHTEALAVIVRSRGGIRRFEELRHRRISVGRSGASYTALRDDLLDAYGWSTADFARSLELGLAEQNRALCDNRVDAIMFEAAQPNGFIQEVTIGCSARLLRLSGSAIAALLVAHPYYVASRIPGGMYDGNPDDVPTFGTQALLVASARQPDALIYSVVQAVLENFVDFRRLHPVLFTLQRGDLVPNVAVAPLHPGATRYFQAAGLLPRPSGDEPNVK